MKDNYWAPRLKKMEDVLKDKSYEYVRRLEAEYDRAIREIDTEIRAWYQRFADNNGIDLTEARRMLTGDELEEFRWTVEEYIRHGQENAISGQWEKELENASARVHVSRLDSLKLRLRQHAEELSGKGIQTTAEAAGMNYTESYYRTAFEVQKGTGVGMTMQGVDRNRLEKVLARPWAADGKDFSARIWTDRTRLVNTLETELTRMLALGGDPSKAINAISNQLGVSKRNAGRIVMTESAYFATEAQKDCFNELGVEEYVIVSALDRHVCETCGELDGKVFKMSEFQSGVTAPPFHPWCRCCTAPHFDDLEGVGERYARDVETGKRYTVPKDMTYKEWKEQQDAKYGAGAVDKQRQKAYNKFVDQKQFLDYELRLGKDSPESFKEFQKLKYESPKEYNKLVGFYSYKGRVPEATKADYAVYQAVRDTGIFGTVRVPPETIDTSVLQIDSAHITQRGHGVTLSEAVSYINDARFSIKRKHQSGKIFINFYSSNGAAYVLPDNSLIRTAFKRAEYDKKTLAAVEAAENVR